MTGAASSSSSRKKKKEKLLLLFRRLCLRGTSSEVLGCDYCRRIGKEKVEMQEGRGGFDGRRALERLVARYPVLKSDEAVASVLAHEGRGIEESGFIEVAHELLLLRSQVGVAAIGCFRPLLPRLLDGVVQSLRQLRRHGIGRSGQQADDTRRLRGEWTLDLHEDASILFSRILELAPYLLRYRGLLLVLFNEQHFV